MSVSGAFAKRRQILLLSLLAAQVPSRPALAQTKEQCISAFDEGQELREALKLRAAREQFLVCSRDACAAMLRRDCARALEDVERDLPTVSLGAQDKSGADLSDLKVTIDGEPVTLDQSGRSVAVDPGQHVVKFERDGYASAVKHVLMRMGERNRVVVVTLRREGDPVDPLGDTPAPATGATPGRKVSPWAFVFGGVGVAALGSFTYFAISGKSEKDRLEGVCSPTCNDSQVSGVRDRYIAADVSLGVGLVALGAAAYFLFFHDRPAAKHP
jgi:hypothetical protein